VKLDYLDHFAITVTNLEISFAWYQKTLGFEMFHKWETTWMIARGQMRVGLFQRPTATKIDDLDQKLAIQHVAFNVTPEALLEAQIELQGLSIPIDGPEDTGVAYSIFINDPDGHLLELTTYHPVPGVQADNAASGCGRKK
jgi:catechol-2,3-dioxygenase